MEYLKVPLIIVITILLISPFFLGSYELHILIITFSYVIVACGWNLLAGYNGQFSLAHHTFVALGGYVSALLALNLGIPPFLSIFVGGLASMLTSYIIGHLCLRLRAIYLAIATWAFSGCFELFIRMQYEWTGGDLGLPTPRLLGVSKVPYYYMSFFIMAISVFIMYKIINSRIGLYIRAIRDDEEAAMAMAVDTVKWKKFMFSIVGFFAGIAGAFRAHYIGLMSPVTAKFDEMIMIILMVIIGGYGTFFGPIIGAPLIMVLLEYLRVYGEIRMILFAALVIILSRFFRGGLVGFFDLLAKYISVPRVKSKRSSSNKPFSS